METCDQHGCDARAIREFWFDNGFNLYACGHHAATWFPWMTQDTRFDPKPKIIVT